MSRTIADLTAGVAIYVDEIVNGVTTHTPYIYLGVDEGGNARLLRQYVLPTQRMNSVGTASYAGCEMDLWLEDSSNGFLSIFDADTLNALVNTSIKYVDYNQSADHTAQVLQISRRCFLLSYSEAGFGDASAGNEGQSYLSALQTFTGKTGNAARIAYSQDNAAIDYWTRSAHNASAFKFVGKTGGSDYSIATNGTRAPRPALSVAASTPVSDEGAEEIFLLPDGRRTTWDVSIEMGIGNSADRPMYASVHVDGSYITGETLQICNNYGDATPVWETCSNTGYAVFTNTTKETTDWEIGIKIHAEGSNPSAYINEPIVLIQVT